MLISPNKDERAVRVYHCPGDMAVRVHKVMAIQPVGVRVCLTATCFFVI